MKYFIGTSGFSYPNWHHKDAFYPKKSNSDLSYYAQHFNFVEINNTFYRFPKDEVFTKWKKMVNKDFIFSVKAHRFFTHMKQFKIDDPFIDQWDIFWKTCQSLTPHLGPLLFQLPPRFKFTLTGSASTIEKLEHLYRILPKTHPIVIECRDASWECEEVFQIFKHYHWSFCVIHTQNQSGWAGNLKTGFFPRNKKYWGTAEWGSYFRLHGSLGQYSGLYSASALNPIIHYQKTQKTQFMYTAFDNTDDAKPSSAIQNAKQLMQALS